MNAGDFLTIEDLGPEGKTILLRTDINTPVDPKTGKLIERARIEEAMISINSLSKSKLVVCSHQGRVGREDYVSLEQHAKILATMLDRDVKFIDDVFGPAAREAIVNLKPGEVLLLENLRFAAEENFEYEIEKAANTHIVRKLYPLLDGIVLDAFPTAHRAHPSIVGFPYYLPTAAGRLIVKELKALKRIVEVAKGPYTSLLGGSKVSDRLEAIASLIKNKKADKVLLTGLIALVFLRASDKIKYPLGIPGEDKYVENAKRLLSDYPDVFEMPIDVAVSRNGERVELLVNKLRGGEKPLDIGGRTVDRYSRIIRSSGTVFMSGPPGVFELEGFDKGTNELLMALATSYGTTIVSGGHLSTALKKLGIVSWIDYISTAGGALIQHLSGKRLPLFKALAYSASKMKSGGYSKKV